LEKEIPSILTGILEYAQRIKIRREERGKAELEEQRRRVMTLELAERRRAHTQLIRQLEMQAESWLRSRILRRYLRALKRVSPALNAKFVEWAEHYINQLDPLCATPRQPDLPAERNTWNVSPDTGLSEFLRFFGHHWPDAKPIPPAPPDSTG
jgi:hypothetical protein